MGRQVEQVSSPPDNTGLTFWEFPVAHGESKVLSMAELKVVDGKINRHAPFSIYDMDYEGHYNPAQEMPGMNSLTVRVSKKTG